MDADVRVDRGIQSATEMLPSLDGVVHSCSLTTQPRMTVLSLADALVLVLISTSILR